MTDFAICLAISLALSAIGSYWINRLYEMPEAPLSFPDEKFQRAKFRRPILFAATFALAVYCISLPRLEGIYFFAAAFFLVLITLTDFEQHVIFDSMTLPFAILGTAATLHLGLPLQIHVGSALIGGGIFLLIAIITHGGIGGGDIKLVAALGLWLGEKLLDVILSGCILGGIAAVIMLITNKKNRHSHFAYGPYFALSAIYILFSTLE